MAAPTVMSAQAIEHVFLAGAVVSLTAAMATHHRVTVESMSKVSAFLTASVGETGDALPLATDGVDTAMISLAVRETLALHPARLTSRSITINLDLSAHIRLSVEAAESVPMEIAMDMTNANFPLISPSVPAQMMAKTLIFGGLYLPYSPSSYYAVSAAVASRAKRKDRERLQIVICKTQLRLKPLS